jgi:uncharacterized membrane protein YqjE
MATEPTEIDGGLFDSLKALASTLVAMTHTRLDLLSTDLEEDRVRLGSLLVAFMLALFSLGVGVVLLALLVVVAFWDTHRLIALGGMAGFFMACGLIAWGVARHGLKTKPRLFAASLAELSKDRHELTLHR